MYVSLEMLLGDLLLISIFPMGQIHSFVFYTKIAKNVDRKLINLDFQF